MKDKPGIAVVLPFISGDGGGVTEAARRLVAGLARRDKYKIEVISFASDSDVAARETWRAAAPGVALRTFRATGPHNYCFAPALAAYLAKSGHDLVHVHGIWMFHLTVATRLVLRGRPCVISPHGMLDPWILARSPRLKAAVSALYQRRALARAATVHVLTEAERHDVRSYVPAARTEIVPNFVPPFGEEDQTALWHGMLSAQRRVFLFFGRIHDKKGWRALLSAWRICCERDRDFQRQAALVFCGWKDDVPDFEAEIEASNRSCGNVIYAGPQFGPARAASFRCAEVFVLPSVSEGLPMAVLEAVRGEAMVLMSRACNLPEMFDRGAAVECGTTPERIAEALLQAFLMPASERTAICSRATEYLEAVHGEAAILDRFEGIYESAMAGASAPQGASER